MTVNSEFPVTSVREVAEDVRALRFRAPGLAASLRPGQFLNILTSDSIDPLLRRPYSISSVHGDECEIMFALVGKGTAHLAAKQPGDRIGVVGPLGNTFGYDHDFATALIVAGGIGVAPFPFLTSELLRRGILVRTFLGVRTAALAVTRGLTNVTLATDDGSAGFHGNVVACLDQALAAEPAEQPRIFACGPTRMLEAVQRYALDRGIDCELSLESEMACGIGICQGCPIEHNEKHRTYALVCSDGPCFDARTITFRKEVEA